MISQCGAVNFSHPDIIPHCHSTCHVYNDCPMAQGDEMEAQFVTIKVSGFIALSHGNTINTLRTSDANKSITQIDLGTSNDAIIKDRRFKVSDWLRR